MMLSGRMIYRNTGTNSSYLENSSYRFGSELQAYLGISDQSTLLKTLVSPSISLKYRHAAKDEIEGFELDNTGGRWLSLIPALGIDLAPNIIFTTRAEIPLYSHVDGTQLTPTYRITSGVIFKMTAKNTMFNLN
jgi:hypothetical protein